MNPFHHQTAFFVVGMLYVIMPMTVWTILRRRHDPVSVRLWSLGGVTFGVGMVLLGLRDAVPDWLSICVANPLTFVSHAMRAVVLLRELRAPPRTSALLWGWAALSALFVAAHLLADHAGPRLMVAALAHMAGAGLLSWLSWSLYRQRAFNSAALLAGAYSLFAVALLVRIFALAGRGDVQPFVGTMDFVLMFIAAILSALYGNLGYLGVALEATRERELRQTADLAREQSRRQESEEQAARQALLLEEKTRSLALRDEVLSTLAHEVRQPLNNASAAIQSAMAELQRVGKPDDGAGATYRLKRANTVLTRVMNTVDNTLADAVLLTGERPVFREDSDIDTVVALAIGDVDPVQQSRVRVVRLTATRTMSMNQNLVRLALRNLLLNALAHGKPGTEVTLEIADSDHPLALVIDVCDMGPGVPADIAANLFQRGVRASDPAAGHGLGLSIARRAMELHGGEARLQRNGPDGACFRLVLPAVEPFADGASGANQVGLEQIADP